MNDDEAVGNEHEQATRKQVQRLERIFKDLNESPRGKKCHGMEGLLEEGKELSSEKPDPDVLNGGREVAPAGPPRNGVR